MTLLVPNPLGTNVSLGVKVDGVSLSGGESNKPVMWLWSWWSWGGSWWWTMRTMVIVARNTRMITALNDEIKIFSEIDTKTFLDQDFWDRYWYSQKNGKCLCTGKSRDEISYSDQNCPVSLIKSYEPIEMLTESWLSHHFCAILVFSLRFLFSSTFNTRQQVPALISLTSFSGFQL